MSSIIPRPFDDILIDRIVTRLLAFRDEQIALDKSIEFDVERDKLNPWQGLRRPLVNVWADDATPKSGSTKNAQDDQVAVCCDLYARGIDGLKTSDKNAVTRLLYLKEQIRYAIYDLNDKHFGYAVGIVGPISPPSWARFKDQGGFPEETIVGGRLSFTVGYVWIPRDVEGDPLVELSWIINLSKNEEPAPTGGAHIDGLEEYTPAS